MADPHDVLRDIRRFLQRRSSEAVLLGEVNLPYPQQVAYFGADDGQELTMQFDFAGMQAFYLSLVRGDPAPLAAALTSRPGLPRSDARGLGQECARTFRFWWSPVPL